MFAGQTTLISFVPISLNILELGTMKKLEKLYSTLESCTVNYYEVVEMFLS